MSNISNNERNIETYIRMIKTRKTALIDLAVPILSTWSDPSSSDVLIASLADQYWVIRMCAAAALGNLSNLKSVPALIRTLNDQNDLVRETVAQALGKLSDTQAEDALINALKNDEESSVRYAAAIALGQIGSIKSIPFLLEVEATDDAITSSRDEVREGATKALKIIRSNSKKL